MPQTHLKISNYRQISFLLLFSFFLFPKAITAQSGLINAMTFEEAEDIAIKSIRRASGIRVKKVELDINMTYAQFSKQLKKAKYQRNCLESNELGEIHRIGMSGTAQANQTVPNIAGLQIRMNEKCFPFKRMRLTDSLDFLGITDEFRLAALRGYIAKNVEFGVQNVWGVDTNGQAQSYVISGEQLEDIKTSTTVIDLAKKIQSSAALPFLSYSAAETIVRNCRYKVTGSNSPDSVPLNRDIKDDINDTNRGDFKTCLDDASFLAKDKNDVSVRYKYGVRSIKVVNNEGNAKFYYLTRAFKNTLDNTINTRKYDYLVDELVKSSGIPSSDKFIATQIVLNSLLKIETTAVSTNVHNIFRTEIQDIRPFTNIRVSRMLFQIYDFKCPPAQKALSLTVSVKNDLDSLCVTPGELTTEIYEQPEAKNYFKLKDQTLDKVTSVSLKKTLKGSMSIEQVIKQVQIIY